MNVTEAIQSRRSVRAFLDRPVDLDLLRELLVKASRAPSGGNIQPWHLDIVAGERMEELKALMRTKIAEQPGGEGTEYDIYPRNLTDAYKARTFQIGELMYGRLGIPREDRKARAIWFMQNFQFFNAPVGLFCFVEREHGPPQWSDLGMYLQTLMLLLREAGLDSCPQECWAMYPKTITSFFGRPDSQMLFTGMAIGWADPDAPVNSLETPRAGLEEIARFHTAAGGVTA